MDPILIEFERDLEKVERLLKMLQYVRAIAGMNRPSYAASDDFLAAATNRAFFAGSILSASDPI